MFTNNFILLLIKTNIQNYKLLIPIFINLVAPMLKLKNLIILVSCKFLEQALHLHYFKFHNYFLNLLKFH